MEIIDSATVKVYVDEAFGILFITPEASTQKQQF